MEKFFSSDLSDLRDSDFPDITEKMKIVRLNSFNCDRSKSGTREASASLMLVAHDSAYAAKPLLSRGKREVGGLHSLLQYYILVELNKPYCIPLLFAKRKRNHIMDVNLFLGNETV